MSQENNRPNQPTTQVEWEMLIDRIKLALPAQLQLVPIQAQVLRKKYDSLIAQGFTEKQALEIIIRRPMFE